MTCNGKKIMYKQRGSMLLTAIFIIIVFSVMLAVLANILNNSSQQKVNFSLGIQAELLADSGIEYAMSWIFPLSKCEEKSSVCEKYSYEFPSWSNGTGWGLDKINQPKYVLLDENNCKNISHESDNPLCNGLRDGCYIKEIAIEPITMMNEKTEILNSKIKFKYKISSIAVCEVPFIDGHDINGSSTYNITREKHIIATDIDR